MNDWIEHTGDDLPAGLQPDSLIDYTLVGEPPSIVRRDVARQLCWGLRGEPGRVAAYQLTVRAPVGDVASNAVGSGARYNAGKAPLHLIPLAIIGEAYDDFGSHRNDPKWQDALDALGCFQMGRDTREQRSHLLAAVGSVGAAWEECAQVLDYGRRKYAEWNWAKGQPWSVPIGSGARHALAGLRGETVDPESGLTHRGHFLCNIVFLLWFMDHYVAGDDRRRAPVVTS